MSRAPGLIYKPLWLTPKHSKSPPPVTVSIHRVFAPSCNHEECTIVGAAGPPPRTTQRWPLADGRFQSKIPTRRIHLLPRKNRNHIEKVNFIPLFVTEPVYDQLRSANRIEAILRKKGLCVNSILTRSLSYPPHTQFYSSEERRFSYQTARYESG